MEDGSGVTSTSAQVENTSTDTNQINFLLDKVKD